MKNRESPMTLIAGLWKDFRLLELSTLGLHDWHVICKPLEW
jgi:hypothetical protein